MVGAGHWVYIQEGHVTTSEVKGFPEEVAGEECQEGWGGGTGV